jgi:hypothetical protein
LRITRNINALQRQKCRACQKVDGVQYVTQHTLNCFKRRGGKETGISHHLHTFQFLYTCRAAILAMGGATMKPRFIFSYGEEIFLFSKHGMAAVLLISEYQHAFSRVKQQKHEADHFYPSRTKKISGAVSSPHTFMVRTVTTLPIKITIYLSTTLLSLPTKLALFHNIKQCYHLPRSKKSLLVNRVLARQRCLSFLLWVHVSFQNQ